MEMRAIGLAVGIGSVIAAGFVGCGSEAKRAAIAEEPTIPIEASVGFGEAGEAAAPCTGLRCAQQKCESGKETTLTGKVYAPNGTLALYNAIVYVPNAEPAALTPGATCDKCGAVTGDPIVTALTDATGSFELKNVPAGKDIPLVIQIGKWRRQVKLPEIEACKVNEVDDRDLTRLPKNRTEGDMPQIALTSGGCDKLGCMLPKLGIDPSEFGVESDGSKKAVHVYIGSGGQGPVGAQQAQSLWSNVEKLKTYDLAILSCECSENLQNKGPQAFAAMTEYLHAGGRIFTTDYMYTWYKMSPDTGLAGVGNIRGGAPPGLSPMTIDQSFPKGKALAEWLQSAAGIGGGQVMPDAMYSNIMAVDPSRGVSWATSAPGDMGGVGPRVMSVNLPVGVPADEQCGKGVHIDAHVNSNFTDQVGPNYPNTCASPFRPAESLLSFFFFDLASCIQNETEAPKPPPVN